jgi:ubiquinone/menaquinone biosynthesis C-methylase UbiE
MDEGRHARLNMKKWDRWSKTADGRGALYDYLRSAQKSVLDLAAIREDMHFLDIGCGTGWAVGEAARLAGFSGVFYGIDMSEGMIGKAKDNFGKYANLHFIVASSESVPLEANQFDIIICTNSFHHYLHPDAALKEMYRLLKKGGKVFILDPTADTWYLRIIDKVIKFLEPQHVKIYSTMEFEQMMLAAGLKYSGFKYVLRKQKVQVGEK